MDFTNKDNKEDDNITIIIETDDENIKEKKFTGTLSEFKYPVDNSISDQYPGGDNKKKKSGGSDGSDVLNGGKKKTRRSNKYLNKRKRSTTLKRV